MEQFVCKVEMRRSEVNRVKDMRQKVDEEERVKRPSEGEGSEEQLFTDK